MSAKKKTTRKPLSHWLNRKNIAASCGISTQAFDNWNVPYAAKIGRETFYTVDDVIENRVARIKLDHVAQIAALEAEIKRIGDGVLEGLDESDREKTLLTREQRIGQELKNAQTRRELAPISLIEWTLGKIGSQISATLEAIPMNIKKILPRLSASEIEHVRREVIKAQNVAAQVTVDIDEFYERDTEGDSQGG